MPLLVLSALAGPLNPWDSATAPGAAGVNPYLYGCPEAVNPPVYASVGVSPHIGTLDLMPRFFVAPRLAPTPHLSWTPGGPLTPAPEVRVNASSGPFTLPAPS